MLFKKHNSHFLSYNEQKHFREVDDKDFGKGWVFGDFGSET